MRVKQYGVWHNEMEPDGDQRHIRSEPGGQRPTAESHILHCSQTDCHIPPSVPPSTVNTHTEAHTHSNTHCYLQQAGKKRRHLKPCWAETHRERHKERNKCVICLDCLWRALVLTCFTNTYPFRNTLTFGGMRVFASLPRVGWEDRYLCQTSKKKRKKEKKKPKNCSQTRK